MSNWLAYKVKNRLDTLGAGPVELAKAHGLEQNFIRDILVGKKQSVRIDGAIKLAKALQTNENFFLSEHVKLEDAFGVSSDTMFRHKANRPPTHPHKTNTPDTISIPEYDVRLSAGGGQIVESEAIKTHWPFARAYLAELKINQDHLSLVEVSGDSMSPTLISGDRVMIDHTDTNTARPGIFALYDSNATVIKRVEKIPAADPAALVLISDNRIHNQYTVPAEGVTIIGRVVWYARKI